MPPIWSPFRTLLPPADRDLRRLLPSGNGETGFESYAAAERERNRRVNALRRHPAPLAAQTAERLAACAAGARCLSPSCSTCVGRLRIWFYSEVAQALPIQQTTAQSALKMITLVNEDWILRRQQILNFNPKVLIDRVRHQFVRAGGNQAIVIGAVHGEYDRRQQYWQPHLHLVAKDLDTATISLLRRRHYQRTSLIYRPMVVQPLNDPAPQVSYLLKSFWPLRERYVQKGSQKSSTFRRIPEPLHSECLMMHDQFNLLDFVFLLGVRRQGHHLVPLRGRLSD